MHARLAWPGSGRPSASGSRRPAPGQPWPLVQRPFCSSWPLSRSRWVSGHGMAAGSRARRPAHRPAIRQERPERPPRCRRLRRGRARLRCLQHPRRRLTRPRRPGGEPHRVGDASLPVCDQVPATLPTRARQASPLLNLKQAFSELIALLPRGPKGDGRTAFPACRTGSPGGQWHRPPTRPGTTGATGMPGWQQNIGTAGGSITDQATPGVRLARQRPNTRYGCSPIRPVSSRHPCRTADIACRATAESSPYVTKRRIRSPMTNDATWPGCARSWCNRISGLPALTGPAPSRRRRAAAGSRRSRAWRARLRRRRSGCRRSGCSRGGSARCGPGRRRRCRGRSGAAR